MKKIIHYVDYTDIPQQTTEITYDEFKKSVLPQVQKPCYIFLDQASNTGFAVYSANARLLMYGELMRDAKEESMTVFANLLVDWLVGLASSTLQVTNIFYEEVYNLKNMVTTEQLFYLKNKIAELSVTHKDLGITTQGLDASAWKAKLANGIKFPKDREAQKKATIKLVEEVFPLLDFDKNDETDALGMSIGIMLRGDNYHEVWKMIRYNKRLPVHEIVMEKDLDTTEAVEEVVAKLRKPFRDAYAVGGYKELELDNRRKIDATVKKYLSYKDVLLGVKIPKKYKYWGLMLLENNINPDDLIREDESFILLSCRKNRL